MRQWQFYWHGLRLRLCSCGELAAAPAAFQTAIGTQSGILIPCSFLYCSAAVVLSVAVAAAVAKASAAAWAEADSTIV